MQEFLRESIPAVVGMLVMATYWLILNYISVKSNVKAIEKMRAEKDLPPMSEDESQIVTIVLRTSVINDAIGPFLAGIIAMVVVYLLS